MNFINLEALSRSEVKNSPFPYTVIPNFICAEHLQSLTRAFPTINSRGSIPARSLELTRPFSQLIDELEGDALRNMIAQKFSMDLDSKPMMLTLRGYTTERDGLIHTDSTSKLITLLLYMNEEWSDPQGQLRLLNGSTSLDDYFEEVSPKAGNCLIFKVTPNGWHGHYPFVGKRLSLQLNYLSGEAALAKHLTHHRLTAFAKRLLNKALGKAPAYEE